MSTRDIYEYTKGEYQTITLIKQSDATAAAKYITFMGVDMAGYDITIYSDSAGASPLTEGLDYTLMYKDTLRSVAESENIYAGYRIDTVVYQGVPLWVSMKTVGGYTKYLGVPNTFNPRSFTTGRYDSQEVQSGVLTTSGWYTIAETDVISQELSLSASFSCVVHGPGVRAGLVFDVAFSTGNNTSVHKNSIAIRNRSKFSDTWRYGSVRIVGSANVSGGVKIQVYLYVSSTVALVTQMSEGLSFYGGDFIKLVTPYLDNTPTLPDGVTVGTFFEAGAILSLASGTTRFRAGIMANKFDNDTIRVEVNWPEKPKNGTGLVVTIPPSGDFVFFDGAGVSSTLAAHSITGFEIDGQLVSFIIVQSGIATSLNSGPLAVRTRSVGAKLTITD